MLYGQDKTQRQRVVSNKIEMQLKNKTVIIEIIYKIKLKKSALKVTNKSKINFTAQKKLTAMR